MLPFLHRTRAVTAEDNPLWLVVLADMMTNLMLFFLVMFAITMQGEPAKQELVRGLEDHDLTRRPPPRPLRETTDFREEAAARALRNLAPEVRVTEDMIRLSLREQLVFPTADDRLAQGAAARLAALADVLRQLPNTVIVEGHTDNVPVAGGPFRSNWELSVARSNSVIGALAAAGVEPARLVAAGYGEVHPAAGNDSAEGRSLNRRVEIVVLRRTPSENE